MNKVARYFDENGIKQSGPVITATFSVDHKSSEPIMDMEILVPMDRKIDLPKEYKFKEVFQILHAVYARHTGRPDMLYNTYNELFKYLAENNLQQITAIYNVYVKGLNSSQDCNDINIDVYIGVNPSTL